MTWQETDPRTHKHIWVQGFSGPPVYRTAGSSSALPSHLLCWHAGYQCLFQRKLWLLLRLLGKWALLSLAPRTALLLHPTSDIKESLARIIWPGSLISALESFDYPKWNRYYYISGSDKVVFFLVLLLFSIIRSYNSTPQGRPRPQPTLLSFRCYLGSVLKIENWACCSQNDTGVWYETRWPTSGIFFLTFPAQGKPNGKPKSQGTCIHINEK